MISTFIVFFFLTLFVHPHPIILLVLSHFFFLFRESSSKFALPLSFFITFFLNIIPHCLYPASVTPPTGTLTILFLYLLSFVSLINQTSNSHLYPRSSVVVLPPLLLSSSLLLSLLSVPPFLVRRSLPPLLSSLCSTFYHVLLSTPPSAPLIQS